MFEVSMSTLLAGGIEATLALLRMWWNIIAAVPALQTMIAVFAGLFLIKGVAGAANRRAKPRIR